MIPYFIAMLLVITKSSAVNDTKCQDQCNGVVYRGTYYDKVKLFEGIWRPTNLMMHKYSRNLFFSHTIKNGSRTDSSIMSCHIENRRCLNITGIPGGRAIAYDRWSNMIYFGGSDGIYFYDINCDEVKIFAEKGKSIWGLDIRRNVFYLEYPTKQIYSMFYGRYSKDSNFINVEVEVFFVSGYFDIFFYNESGLYVLDPQEKTTQMLSDNINVTQITGDINGDIFISANDGVYMYSMGMTELTKVANISNVYGITFAGIKTKQGESYQLIYSDENSINMLVPRDPEESCEREAASNCVKRAVSVNITSDHTDVISISTHDPPICDPQIVIPSAGVICVSEKYVT